MRLRDEEGDRLLPVEVKAAGRPQADHVWHLRTFLDQVADRPAGGRLLHASDEVFCVARGILAVPWWRIL